MDRNGKEYNLARSPTIISLIDSFILAHQTTHARTHHFSSTVRTAKPDPYHTTHRTRNFENNTQTNFEEMENAYSHRNESS